MTLEVEQKYHVADAESLIDSLRRDGWTGGETELHRDLYLNHPCKDFAETGEALRVRRIDDRGHITYKGPKMAGEIKARQEMEWWLGEADPDGERTETLLQTLGFRPVAEVCKSRMTFERRGENDPVVVVDDVAGLGCFAEIELVIDEAGEVPAARQRISDLAARLGLDRPEHRSYLTMQLQSNP